MANKLIESKGGVTAIAEADGRTRLAQEVKEAWHSAFRALQKNKKFSLLAWAKKNPTEFYKLCQKFVPSDVNISGNVALQVITGVPGIADLIDQSAPDIEEVGLGGVGDAHDPGLANGIKADFIDDGSDLA